MEKTDTQSSIVNRQIVNQLMTCKYCLLFELGHCRKTNPYPIGKEPRFLRLKNGTTLRLTFDCKNCQMLIDQ